MPLTRRSFVSALGIAGAASAVPWISARGSEGVAAGDARLTRGDRRAPALIRLDSNENPHGPASDAIDAVMRSFGDANRYPDSAEDALKGAIAAHHRVPVESVLLGCGSTEILMAVTEALTSRTRHLVTIAPSFETTVDTAKRMGTEVRSVVVDASMRADLDAMLAQSAGAGLVYLCNPNNPTGTMNGSGDVARFVAAVTARTPGCHVVIDEAYFEYVDDPSYTTAIPLALADPHVIVVRTFSKVYGMAGLRAGYAIAAPGTIARLDPYRVPSGINALVGAAAIASLELPEHVERQRTLNREGRDFATRTMTRLGFSVVPSQANFFLTDIRRDPKAFQAACKARGVAVGRYFPPLKTHARISIGTMQEMQQAMGIISEILKAT
jgi:histidinol-phosphate aminotransferase